MTLFISNASSVVLCDAQVDRIDAGAAAGTLVIYDGTIPTDADTALSGNTVLATLTFTDPAFGGAVDDTPGAIATASSNHRRRRARRRETAAFFRVFDSNSADRAARAVRHFRAGIEPEPLTIASGAPVPFTS